MRALFFASLLPLLATAIFVSCRSDETVLINGSDRDIVESARCYFEVAASSVAPDTVTRSRRLSPGEFAPQWERATVSDEGGHTFVDVPIVADFLYRASLKGADGAPKTTVNMFQKLVVSKDNRSGKMTAYILTLIPDANHSRGGRDICYRFATGGDKAGYSGLALLTRYGRNTPERITRYRDGEPSGEEVCRDAHPGLASLRRLGTMLPDMELVRMVTQTRSGLECVLGPHPTPNGNIVCPSCSISNLPICICPDHGSHDYTDDGLCEKCMVPGCGVCQFCFKPLCVCINSACRDQLLCQSCKSPSCVKCGSCGAYKCNCHCIPDREPPYGNPPHWDPGYSSGTAIPEPPYPDSDYSVPMEYVDRVFIFPDDIAGSVREQVVNAICAWTIPYLLDVITNYFPGDEPYVNIALTPELESAAYYNVDENTLYLKRPDIFGNIADGRKLCEEIFKIGQVYHLPLSTNCVTKETFRLGADGCADVAFEMKFFADLFIGYRYKALICSDTFDRYTQGDVYNDYEAFLQNITYNFKRLTYYGGTYGYWKIYDILMAFREQFTYKGWPVSDNPNFASKDNQIVLVSFLL